MNLESCNNQGDLIVWQLYNNINVLLVPSFVPQARALTSYTGYAAETKDYQYLLGVRRMGVNNAGATSREINVWKLEKLV